MKLLLVLMALPALTQAQGQTYRNLPGQELLNNDRVLVQKFVLAPGKSTGEHAAHGAAVRVVIHGGTLISNSDQRAVIWKDGSVFWSDATTEVDQGSTNKGSKPVEFLWVSLKPVTKPFKQDTEHPYLGYPNVPGEDLFENNQVVIQRFAMKPGECEGVHAHRPNMLYIFTKGGQWSSRSYKQAQTDSGNSPDGDVGWMRTVAISEGHQSCNVGKTTSEVVWLTFKH